MSSEQADGEHANRTEPAALFAREQSVIWVLCLTYGAFYFGRTNLSVAVPGLKASLADGGLALDAEQVGYILGSLKIAYGVGQVLNGQLAERVSPRLLIALGLLGSAALNVLFGLGVAASFLLFVWACNGYCQSMGWTPCMRVAANWVPVLRRGRAIGIIGMGYQVTQGLTFLVAGWAAETFGWRGALFVPAGLLVVTALFMLLCLEESPDHPASRANDQNAASSVPASIGPRNSWGENLLLTLTNPGLWLLGLALGLVNACRYGFLDWGVTHLKEIQESGVSKAALQYALLPVGAVAGCYLAGWATDRFFGGRRAPVICMLCLLLALLALLYGRQAAHLGPAGVIGLLMLIGFCIYGPQVLLVGTAPADLARRGTSAAAAGFVNFLGYVGAFAGDVVTGNVLNRYGWETAIRLWAGWALAAAVAAALLWNARPRSEPRSSS